MLSFNNKIYVLVWVSSLIVLGCLVRTLEQVEESWAWNVSVLAEQSLGSPWDDLLVVEKYRPQHHQVHCPPQWRSVAVTVPSVVSKLDHEG